MASMLSHESKRPENKMNEINTSQNLFNFSFCDFSKHHTHGLKREAVRMRKFYGDLIPVTKTISK